MLRIDDIKQVMLLYLEDLRRHRDDLNRINVFPIPDHDTGTNLTQTMEALVAAAGPAATAAEFADRMERAALHGARGYSGMILAQFLSAFSSALGTAATIDAATVTTAMQAAATAARAAVAGPVEGTILTVADAAAAGAASRSDDAAGTLRAAHDRAVSALRTTPALLPVLRRAGVVDAGAAGLVLLLGSFVAVAAGTDVPPLLQILPARTPEAGDEE